MALIISDVPGDPLDLIASGPTVPDDASTPQAALAVLEKFPAPDAGFSARASCSICAGRRTPTGRLPPPTCQVTNLVIGNNATAVEAAGAKAESLGYGHAMVCAQGPEGLAEDVGRHLADMALRMRAGRDRIASSAAANRPSGWSSRRAAAAADGISSWCWPRWCGWRPTAPRASPCSPAAPTGKTARPTPPARCVDATVLAAVERSGLDAADYLARNDAYHFFAPLGALIKTGPTHTNVGDLRVVVVEGRMKDKG